MTIKNGFLCCDCCGEKVSLVIASQQAGAAINRIKDYVMIPWFAGIEGEYCSLCVSCFQELTEIIAEKKSKKN